MDFEPIKINNLVEKTKESILKYIEKTNIDINNKLPSEENLSSILGVSRVTVRSALNDLANEGIIFRRQGKGTFINREAIKLKVKLNPINEFGEIIKNSGYKPKIKILDNKIIRADISISNDLDIEIDSEVLKTQKVFFADESPCAYCIDYLPVENINKESIEDLIRYEGSLYRYLLNKYNIKIAWDKVEIFTTTNSENIILNKIFQCKEEPKSFLVIKGVNYDINDKPICITFEYIDTKIITFNLIRQRSI